MAERNAARATINWRFRTHDAMPILAPADTTEAHPKSDEGGGFQWWLILVAVGAVGFRAFKAGSRQRNWR